MTMYDDATKQALEIGRRELQGRSPEYTGVVLAELTSIWLGGFVNDQLREEIITMHFQLIRDLIGPNAEMIRDIRRAMQ